MIQIWLIILSSNPSADTILAVAQVLKNYESINVVGFASDLEKEYTCSVSMIESHQKRISSPLHLRPDRYPHLQTSSDMGPAEICQFYPSDEASTNPVRVAMQQLKLSAIAYHLILKLTRTIAHLAGTEDIQIASS